MVEKVYADGAYQSAIMMIVAKNIDMVFTVYKAQIKV